MRAWIGVQFTLQICLLMEYIEYYLSLEENKLKEILPKICETFSNLEDPGAMDGCVENIGVALVWYMKHDLGRS